MLRRLAFLLLLSATLAAQELPPTRIVVRPVVNMFSAPSSDTDVVSQAIYATRVAVLEQKDGWTRIKTPDDYTGWVDSSALLSRDGAPYAAGKDIVVVRSLFAHVYREDNVTRHAPLVTVPFETALERHPESAQAAERWTTVRLPDGTRGFIQNGDIGAAGRMLTADETIALAKRFLGLPYTWGGTSSYGYDCSGFMQMLMRQRGYTMPRDAGPQARWNGHDAVTRATLQPGDLLYFGASIERITHTGMYIGNGQFINATTHETPMVRIDNLDDPYWTRLLVAARRLKS